MVVHSKIYIESFQSVLFPMGPAWTLDLVSYSTVCDRLVIIPKTWPVVRLGQPPAATQYVDCAPP